MGTRSHVRASTPPDPLTVPLDSAAIDAKYGLEPVFDPAAPPKDPRAPKSAALAEFVAILCPYCGEPIDVTVDLTAGARAYVEDCSVCCHPIEFAIRMTPRGRFAGLSSTRIDG